MNKQVLLKREVSNINRWLSCVEGDLRPYARIGDSGETVVIEHYPLPDQYKPDRINIALVVKYFPADPPKGLYTLKKENNLALIQQLREKFNVFLDKGFHGAPSITGYEWICVGYLDGWRYNVEHPSRGDNIEKMLRNFWALLEE